jgi:hypothetical protein
MRFDVAQLGRVDSNGMRNFRQALASPHPGLFHRVGAVLLRFEVLNMTSYLKRFALVAVLAGLTSACALSLRNPDIADLQRHPARYYDRTVSVSGTVTTSWGLPLVPFRFYRVDDGTGEVTVLSQGLRMPARGEHVRVKGKVADMANFGGRAIGLHLREESLYVKRD